VRPEKIRIGQDLGGLANAYEAVVEEVIYQGSSTNYQARLSGGRLVTVTVQNAEMDGGFRAGESVRIGWQPEKGILITEGVE
jgi:putative spermidine/putrescine transport system ATP-binding protein